MAVPTGDADGGPFGVTVIGRAFADHLVADLARLLDPGPAVEPAAPSLPPAALGPFLHELPEPMTLGKVLLDGGSLVTGFVCEPYGTVGAADISHFGSWPAYLAG